MYTEKKIILKENLSFRNNLKKEIEEYDMKNRFSEIVFLCVGTNKITGDMIGPIVGQKLKDNLKQENVKIYGDMINTLNLKNASKIIKKVKAKYLNPFYITIDTALGKENMINKIIIGKGKIEIGKAIRDGIEFFSHINIKVVVGKYDESSENNMKTLENVNSDSIIYLSNIITNGILETIR